MRQFELGRDSVETPFATFGFEIHEPRAVHIQILDVFLSGTALFVFAISLYALFIGPLDLPDWMVASNFHELKVKLGSVLILFMAGVFIERLVQGKDALDLLFLAGAVAVVSFALLALGNVKVKD